MKELLEIFQIYSFQSEMTDVKTEQLSVSDTTEVHVKGLVNGRVAQVANRVQIHHILDLNSIKNERL